MACGAVTAAYEAMVRPAGPVPPRTIADAIEQGLRDAEQRERLDQELYREMFGPDFLAVTRDIARGGS